MEHRKRKKVIQAQPTPPLPETSPSILLIGGPPAFKIDRPEITHVRDDFAGLMNLPDLGAYQHIVVWPSGEPCRLPSTLTDWLKIRDAVPGFSSRRHIKAADEALYAASTAAIPCDSLLMDCAVQVLNMFAAVEVGSMVWLVLPDSTAARTAPGRWLVDALKYVIPKLNIYFTAGKNRKVFIAPTVKESVPEMAAWLTPIVSIIKPAAAARISFQYAWDDETNRNIRAYGWQGILAGDFNLYWEQHDRVVITVDEVLADAQDSSLSVCLATGNGRGVTILPELSSVEAFMDILLSTQAAPCGARDDDGVATPKVVPVPIREGTGQTKKRQEGPEAPRGHFIPDPDWSGVNYRDKYYPLRNRDSVRNFLKKLHSQKAFDAESAITLKQAGVDRKWKTLFQGCLKEVGGQLVKSTEAQKLEQLTKCIGETTKSGIKRVFIKMY